MTSRITQAHPPLEFIPPDLNPSVLWLGQQLLPAWLRWRNGLVRTETEQIDTLIDLFEQFQAGKIRFLLAFRHPSTLDPLCINQVVWNQLPAIARAQKRPLQHRTHLHFIYDRGIPLWAGPAVGWLISKLGGTPIRRGSLDTAGLRSIRNLFANGPFPMAAAPEGGTNGHNEIVSAIEPGIAQFGFWCVDDLKKAGRSEAVLIVPVGIQYFFVTPPWRSLADLLTQLEQESGLPCDEQQIRLLAQLQDGDTPSSEQESLMYQRLYRLGEHLLKQMEGFYTQYYRQTLVSRPQTDAPGDGRLAPLGVRLQALLSTALDVAEQSLGLKSNGSLTDRCRRVEQAGWDRIYRNDLKAVESLSLLERGLADLVAEETHLRLWHMRLVETFVSVTGKYVAERPTIERFADTLLLIWKMLRQIARKPIDQPPSLGDRYARLTVGEPISVSDRWGDYQAQRKGAIAQMTQDLQSTLENLII